MKKFFLVSAYVFLLARCSSAPPVIKWENPVPVSMTTEAPPITEPSARSTASEFSHQKLKNAAKAVFENSAEKIGEEFVKSMDLLTRLYYHSRKSVADYDAILFAKNEAGDDLEAKKDRLADAYAQIEVQRQIIYNQETRVQYLFEELFWRRFSPTTSEKTFNDARDVQKYLQLHFFNKLTAKKSDAFALQHVYDHIELLYTQIVENSSGLIKNESGMPANAPQDLAVAFKFANIKVQSQNQLKALLKDPASMKHFRNQMEKSVIDEEINILLLQHAEEIKQKAADLKALRREMARVPQQEAKQLYPSAEGPGNIVGKPFLPNTWVLTFDDGPHKDHSNEIMTALAKYGLPANFFWLAEGIANPNLQETIRHAYRDGASIGNHSWDHRSDFVSIGDDPEAMKIEFDDSQATLAKTITDAVGANYTPRFYRCPYGSCIHIPVMRQKIANMGLLHAYWMIDSLDWEDKDPDSIVARVKKEMELNQRGVILFHDIQPQTVIASEMMAKYLADLEAQKQARVVSLCQAVDEANGANKAEYCPGNYFKWLDK